MYKYLRWKEGNNETYDHALVLSSRT